MGDFALVISTDHLHHTVATQQGFEGQCGGLSTFSSSKSLFYKQTFLEESYKQPLYKRLLHSILQCFKEIFNIEKPEKWVERIELYDHLNVYIIRVPYSLEELKQLRKRKVDKVNKMISRICGFYNINDCIPAKKISGGIKPDVCIGDEFTGQYLFRCLLTNVLDEIYTKRGIKISSLDIAIINGKDMGELYTIISQLSPLVKYITVLTDNKDEIEDAADRIYSDTGLSIRLTCDYKNALKYIDLIINLREDDFVFKPDDRVVILNYGLLHPDHLPRKSQCIQGVDIDLPESISNRLPKDVYHYFSKLEMTEIILTHKTDVERRSAVQISEIIQNEFNCDGYKVTALVHSTIKQTTHSES